jgi:hypothetical protein
VTRPSPHRLRRPAAEWSVAFGVLLLAVSAWALATPLGAAPDEPAHLIRAASLVRGELLGRAMAGAPADLPGAVVVKVPDVFVDLANDVGCFQFKPMVPAGCQQPVAGAPVEVTAETYVGRYPPLYYAVVGLPTLAFPNAAGMYLARFTGGALAAALLALAVVMLRRCRGAPLVGAGMAVAVTPMSLYLASVVNPSGLEIASATSAWVAAMALCSQPEGELRRTDVAALGASLVILALTRPLTPLWALAIAAATAGFGLRVPWRTLLRRRCTQAWLAAFAGAGVAALGWDLAADPFLTVPGMSVPRGTSTQQLFVMALQRLELVFTSTIGQFGWLESPSPFGVIVAWCCAAGVLLLAGAAAGRLRGNAVLASTLALWVALPLGLVMVEARTHGILGQGRDFMALVIGAPIAAATLAGQPFAERRTALRLSAAVISVTCACQLADFYAALRRNTVGSGGPLDAFAHVPRGWHPPVPAAALVIVFALSIAALGLLLQRAAVSGGAGWARAHAHAGEPALAVTSPAGPATAPSVP